MADSNPIVSIVIPHYNRAELLEDTLASIRAQTYRYWQAIIVDDQSEGGQWQAIRKHADDVRVQVLRRGRPPKGPSTCRNIGLATASGDYVIFLDSDDLLAPWCLQERVEAIEADPSADFLVFPVLLFDAVPTDRSELWNELDTPESDLHRFLRSDPPWCVTSPVWRIEALQRVAGFNEQVLYGDDCDLHIRALLGGQEYRKFGGNLPDAFIRRSDATRITNTVSAALIRSRHDRLREGSIAMLQSHVAAKLQAIWEGQYLVEAEFLLFNVDAHREPIRSVLHSWRQLHRPTFTRRLIVQSYLWIAMATRRHAYLILRVARRIAMNLLPRYYFSKPGSFQSAKLAPAKTKLLQMRLTKLETRLPSPKV